MSGNVNKPLLLNFHNCYSDDFQIEDDNGYYGARSPRSPRGLSPREPGEGIKMVKHKGYINITRKPFSALCRAVLA